VLVDYGEDYWPAHDRNVARAVEVKREEVLAAAAAARRAPGARCACLTMGSGITPDMCQVCTPMQAKLKAGHALRARGRGSGSGSDGGGGSDEGAGGAGAGAGGAAEAAPPKAKRARAAMMPLSHTYVAVKSCGGGQALQRKQQKHKQQQQQPGVARERAQTPDNLSVDALGDDSGDDGAAGAPMSPSSSSPPASPAAEQQPAEQPAAADGDDALMRVQLRENIALWQGAPAPAPPSHAPAPAPAPALTPAAALCVAVQAACDAAPCAAALLALHARFLAGGVPPALVAARAAVQDASQRADSLREVMAAVERMTHAETRDALMQSTDGRDLAADLAAADAAAAGAAAEVTAAEAEAALLAAQRMPAAVAVPPLSDAEEQSVVGALASLCAACNAAAVPCSAALGAYREVALPRVRAALRQLAAQRAADAGAAEATAAELQRQDALLAAELPALAQTVQRLGAYLGLLATAREKADALHARALAAAAAADEARAVADELAAAAGAD
jgi:hypothetical protein